jgi:hypothetical protein
MQATDDALGDEAKGAAARDTPAEKRVVREGGSATPAPRGSVRRAAVWREVLGTWWLGLPVLLSALGAAQSQFGWRIPGVGLLGDLPWAWLLVVLVLASLFAGALEGAHRAVARREREAETRRQEIERLVRIPQRRLVEAKYQLYRDAFTCTQLVGFLMMSKMEASAMTPETALAIEQSWGDGFLERSRRRFGSGRFGDVFSDRIGGIFPPPRDQAMAVYIGLADFLRLLAERITEGDLDPAYLHGGDGDPRPAPRGAPLGAESRHDAHPVEPEVTPTRDGRTGASVRSSAASAIPGSHGRCSNGR